MKLTGYQYFLNKILHAFDKVNSPVETGETHVLPSTHFWSRNATTTRIWYALDKNGIPDARPTKEVIISGGIGVGHASVDFEEEKLRVSIFPEGGFNAHESVVRGIKRAVGAVSSETVDGDELSESIVPGERRKADLTTTFYSLDKEKMMAKYREMKASIRYVAKPTLFLGMFFDQVNSENCSSAAYKVLAAGGINELSPKCAALDGTKLVITPHALAECIKDAKKNEELSPEIHMRRGLS